jgi:hypothetical protein
MKHRFALRSAALLVLCGLSVGSVTAAVTTPNQESAAAVSTVSQYQLRSHQGTLCIYRNGILIQDTGISVEGLPAEDRAELEAGLSVSDAAALAALLEDFDL